jgi:hypothetical protein
MKYDCEKCVHHQQKKTEAGTFCLCSFSFEHKEKQRRDENAACDFFLEKDVAFSSLKATKDFIIGYRSIGESELRVLLAENPVYGRCKYSNLPESGCTLPYGAISFFLDDLKWRDKTHIIDITVALPNDAQKGMATYWASENFGQTGIWSGRRGNMKYEIEEAYIRCYWPQDVISINVRSRYASHFVERTLKPFCEKYDITLIWENKVIVIGGKRK